MKIKTLVVGSLQTNCYLVCDGEEGVIIDPGDDVEYIINTLRDLDIIPKAILATHAHFDHVLAVSELKMTFSIPFLLGSADQALLTRTRQSTQHFTGFDPGPSPTADGLLLPNQTIQIGNGDLKVLAAPGHTPGGVVFVNTSQKIAFVGDLLFADGGLGRTDFAYSNQKDLLSTIVKIRKKLRGYTLFPGHGERFAI